MVGSNPCSASHSRAGALSSTVTRFSSSWFSSSKMNLSTIWPMTLRSSWSNSTTASSRLRNSGENVFAIASIASGEWSWVVKPIDRRWRCSAPALVVITTATLRKSALRPLLSVRVPWSMTWSRMLNTSGCAFSISSRRSTQWGCLLIASVSRPPWSNPTYPGGAPMRRETVCRSMYSDMSKRTSSTPSRIASWRVTSVLPTPVGPARRKQPTGRSGSRSPERAVFTAATSVAIARSCPNTSSFRSRSRWRMTSRSDLETERGGIRAIFATTASTSVTPIVFFRFDGGSRRWDAPASSMTSMALSGSSRSLM